MFIVRQFLFVEKLRPISQSFDWLSTFSLIQFLAPNAFHWAICKACQVEQIKEFSRTDEAINGAGNLFSSFNWLPLLLPAHNFRL